MMMHRHGGYQPDKTGIDPSTLTPPNKGSAGLDAVPPVSRLEVRTPKTTQELLDIIDVNTKQMSANLARARQQRSISQVENVARAICRADGVDPDAVGVGLGKRMPEGESYPLWMARRAQAEAAIAAMGGE